MLRKDNKKHWCHIIGSDAHNNGRRNFCLGDVIKKLKNQLAQEYYDTLMKIQHILKGIQ